MSKHKTVAIRLIAAIAMLCAAIAMFFGAAFAYADEVAEVMEDPTYEMIAFGAGDSMKIMSDGTVQGNLAPTTGFGGRANSNGLGEASRYSIADGVSITIKNLTISAEACFTVAMQTVSTGTIGQGVIISGSSYGITPHRCNGHRRMLIKFWTRKIPSGRRKP